MNASDIPALYIRGIRWIGDGTGLPDMFLHVHAGMIIFIMTRLVTGKSFGRVTPLLAVFCCEMANEVMDRLNYGSWRWIDTGTDIVNTLFWPTIIFLTVRGRPIRVKQRRQRHSYRSRDYLTGVQTEIAAHHES